MPSPSPIERWRELAFSRQTSVGGKVHKFQTSVAANLLVCLKGSRSHWKILFLKHGINVQTEWDNVKIIHGQSEVIMHHLIHGCNVEKRAAKLQLHSYSSIYVFLTCFFLSFFNGQLSRPPTPSSQCQVQKPIQLQNNPYTSQSSPNQNVHTHTRVNVKVRCQRG